jgi:hypothetical protein
MSNANTRTTEMDVSNLAPTTERAERRRTNRDRMAAMAETMQRGEGFRSRITEAGVDVLRLADLMAEAIEMAREARGVEVVGGDGRTVFGMEEMQAAYCLDAARAAYLVARGSNHD